jgi:hypothetical protein
MWIVCSLILLVFVELRNMPPTQPCWAAKTQTIVQLQVDLMTLPAVKEDLSTSGFDIVRVMLHTSQHKWSISLVAG